MSSFEKTTILDLNAHRRAEEQSVGILLVDDEAEVLQLLQSHIKAFSDVHIVTAANASEGLAQLHKKPVDIVISDLQMPDINGIEFLRDVQTRYPHTIRIMLSGMSDFQCLSDAINQCGISHFIGKPWQLPELRLMIDGVIQQIHLQRQNQALMASLEARNSDNAHLAASLEESFIHMIRLLTDVMAEISHELAQHAKQVAALSTLVATELSLSESQSTNLEIAGLLHDLGLLGLPREVYTSPPTRLYGEFRELFAQHPEVGADMLKVVPRLSTVRNIIRLHHDNLDGSGLTGADESMLSVEMRVLRVCDYYDEAVFLRRENRQNTIGYLKRREGSWFDAAAVNALIDVVTRLHGPLLVPLPVQHLEHGMKIGDDVCTLAGQKLVPAGTVITPLTLRRLQNFSALKQIKDVYVHKE